MGMGREGKRGAGSVPFGDEGPPSQFTGKKKETFQTRKKKVPDAG